MELEEIHSVEQLITIPLEEFTTAWLQDYLKYLLIRYSDRVIAFDIDPQYSTCKVLLRGERKYFLLSLPLKSKILKRIYDKEMRSAGIDKMIITNIIEFQKFEKLLLLSNLNSTSQTYN